jgi:hypothetical protein
MPHLDEGTLHALLDGEIPSAELPPIQAHLGACAECRARLAEEQELLAESDRLIEVLELPPAAPAVTPVRTSAPRRRWPTRLAWAATLVLAAGLGYSVRGGPAGPAPAASADSRVELQVDEPVAAPVPTAPEPVNQSRDQAAAPELRRAAPPKATAGSERAGVRNAAPAEEKAEQLVARVDSAPPPPVPGAQPPSRPAAPTTGLGRAGALRQEEARLREMAPAGALANAFAVAQPATLPEAMRVLGGSLRLIDGLIPERLEILGHTVRVVYRTGFGELLLSQELQDGKVRFTLIPPRGFPADSLERLRGRVRE